MGHENSFQRNFDHWKMMILHFFLSLIFGLLTSSPLPEEEPSYDLTILHINDIHAHIEQGNTHSTRCRPENAEADECYGGVARVYQKQLEIRQQDPDALFLNAGDFFQGTVWYTEFKYAPMIEFGNLMNFTAMGVGNHDFDDSITGFAPFAENSNYDLLASNIENTIADGSFEEGKHYKKSTIKTVKGRKIGIIGYITQSTSYNFPNGTLSFTDEIESVRAEAKMMKENNVTIIIALGHSGYDIDQELAAQIPELDLVVGGHSHTFLYTDTGAGLPSTEASRGDYPTYVENRESGKIIPVVQAYCYTKYLGHLQISFDAAGELLEPVDGKGVSFAEPILLDKNIQQNETVLDKMARWQANLTEYKAVVGENTIILKEEGPSEESNIGDVICQSMAAVYPNTTISFSNNGGIRSSLAVGNLTYEDVLYVLPFDNTVDFVNMKGSGIRASIENAAAGIDSEDLNKYPGFGYQLSGLRVKIVVTPNNAGSRVADLQVEDINGVFAAIQDEEIYNVALPSFLAGGGTKFQKQMRGVFDDHILTHDVGEVMIYQALRTYIEDNTPLAQEVDGRLWVGQSNNTTTTSTTTADINTTTTTANDNSTTTGSSTSISAISFILLISTLGL